MTKQKTDPPFKIGDMVERMNVVGGCLSYHDMCVGDKGIITDIELREHSDSYSLSIDGYGDGHSARSFKLHKPNLRHGDICNHINGDWLIIITKNRNGYTICRGGDSDNPKDRRRIADTCVGDHEDLDRICGPVVTNVYGPVVTNVYGNTDVDRVEETEENSLKEVTLGIKIIKTTVQELPGGKKETRYSVNGSSFDDVDNDKAFNLIEQNDAEIDRLENIPTQSKTMDAHIVKLQSQSTKLAAMIDKRSK